MVIDSIDKNKSIFKCSKIQKALLWIHFISISSIFLHDWIEFLEMEKIQNGGILICFWSPWMNSFIFIPIISILGSLVSIHLLIKNKGVFPKTEVRFLLLSLPLIMVVGIIICELI